MVSPSSFFSTTEHELIGEGVLSGILGTPLLQIWYMGRKSGEYFHGCSVFVVLLAFLFLNDLPQWPHWSKNFPWPKRGSRSAWIRGAMLETNEWFMEYCGGEVSETSVIREGRQVTGQNSYGYLPDRSFPVYLLPL